MNDAIASKIVDAYRASPLLTGLLALNLVIFAAMGWYIVRVNQGAGEFVREQIARNDALVAKLMECGR